MKVFKCEKCGKLVLALNNKPCPTMCCGEAMVELVPGSSDGAMEKHVPAVTVNGNRVEVVVGSVAHPMLEEHHIAWIALETGNRLVKVDLRPGAEPKASFTLEDGETSGTVYEYCNLHGLWKAEF